ncbi:MAG: hypothetical protein FJ088_01390 [Deltaproteobacteria bacterium]|nr:hypothetical protein [Deltaproteobacteria bacterium]
MNKSLILAEILSPDRFRHYRNETYPFIYGFVKKAGIRVHWTRMGSPAAAKFPDRFFADVSCGDRDFLSGLIHEWNATHLIFNESLSLDFSDYLRKNFDGIKIFSIGDWPETVVEPLDQYATPGWLADFLDLGENRGIEIKTDVPLCDQAVPDYGYDSSNDLAREIAPFIKIICGLECLYMKTVNDNPHYAGVDLSKASRDYGCAFCEGGGIDGAEWRFSRQPLDMAFLQIGRAVETFPARTGQFRFMIMGAVIFAALEKFIERLLKTDIPPSAFLFSARADELLGKKKAIERFLPLLRERGHSIHIWVIGIENFSERENERLNKGLSIEKILECDELVRGWEERYPDTFVFSRYGGYSFILFTPWTEIKDLRKNLEYAKKLNVDPRGFFLRSRLQLMPERPITLLAERDGLLAEKPDIPEFDSGCVQTWQISELAWRFKKSEVSHICGISSRLAPGVEEMKGDELYANIQDWIRRLPEGLRDPFILFETLLDAVEENPAGTSAFDTVQEMERILSKRHGSEFPAETAGGLAALQGTGTGFFSPAFSALSDRIGDRLRGALLAESQDGYKIKEVRKVFSPEDGKEQIEICFDGRGSGFSLHIEAAAKDRKYYLASRKYGVCYHKNNPPETAGEKALLSITARILKDIEMEI